VARLRTDNVRLEPEYVVGGGDSPASGLHAREASRPPDEGNGQRRTEQPRRVPRARDVTRLVESVGIHVVRVAQPELLGLGVHQRHEALHRAVADVERQRHGSVIRARHEGPEREVAHRHLLTRAKEERRLADPGRRGRDGDELVRFRMLQSDEDRHQLGDARHRP
jgi:hypothetical protein